MIDPLLAHFLCKEQFGGNGHDILECFEWMAALFITNIIYLKI